MLKQKNHFMVIYIISALCWIATIIPSTYVLYHAFDSMDGTIHGFNGEMLYGIDAFMDTILMFIAFFFPLFFLWGICLLGAIITTAIVIYMKLKRMKLKNIIIH